MQCGKWVFEGSLELSLRDQCAHWSWQSPNNFGRFVRAFVRFLGFSEDPGDCHVASLLAMTAVFERFKQQFVIPRQLRFPDAKCLQNPLFFPGRLCYNT